MVGIPGHAPDPIIERRMTQQKIAAYILFRKNTPNVSITQSLTHQLQIMAEKAGIAPLLIAIDQEHGRVIRIDKGITRFPAAYGLGRIGNPGYVFNACKIAGQELRALGINVNFAPVADINTNPENPIIGTRSYGENPFKVAQLVKQAILGYQSAGIICSAKHFPGHGDVETDSHLALPVSTKTIKDLHETELKPFKSAISVKVPVIMTAHIMFPQIDSEWPATLSPILLTELLRNELQYDGVIISDDLEMKALNQSGPITDLSVKMILAGCDMLIISQNLTCDISIDAIFQALLNAVQDNIISESRLNQSVERILKLKQKVQQKLSPDIINHPDHAAVSEKMMREIFLENPHSRHFPVDTQPERLLIISDNSEILNICPGIKTNRLLLTPDQSLKTYQSTIAEMDEIFIFLSRISYLPALESLQFTKNQNIRFFSLNNPYIQSKIQLPLTSYINLYAECLPLATFNGLIFANFDANK
ncbi:MAG: beta-N-acetylhexosaminidase [Candidatus Magnetoglobus multicellularis str. Araruama]|uniref:beta-N-acetylhexosaminidase n=1 Tax=Candidatus Magnetoglobus multicellularis str. Araruama TaxID=890399 RepID=A0A1V1PEA3_9BACT|nr:MAG: beta-N-acetylhexosaminidase [Candidatus Magnetoglobus multicellularis str. Araruama]